MLKHKNTRFQMKKQRPRDGLVFQVDGTAVVVRLHVKLLKRNGCVRVLRPT